MKKDMPEGFVDLTKILDDFLETGESKTNTKKLSLENQFREVIEEAEIIEREKILIKTKEEEFLKNFSQHSKKTRGRRRINRDTKLTSPATLSSIIGNITSGTPGNLTFDGSNFGATATIQYVAGGTSASSSGTPNESGTQVTAATPVSIYSQSPGTSVSISLVNASGTPSNSVTTTVQAVLKPAAFISSIVGDIQNSTATQLTINGTTFDSAPATVRFIGLTTVNVTATSTTNTQIVVNVPADIYNEAIGNVITIRVIRGSDGQASSNTVDKTIIA